MEKKETEETELIHYKLSSDQYVRKSITLGDAEITYKEDTRFNATTERIGAVALKAVQDTLFSFAKKDKIQHELEERRILLKERYCSLALETRRKKLELEYSKIDKPLPPTKLELPKYKLDEFEKLAYIAAFKDVLRANISGDDLKFKFAAAPLFEIAGIPRGNTRRLKTEVGNLQRKFNNWTEKYFDEEIGDIRERDYDSTLFPTSVYYRRGTGYQNYIELKLNDEMMHLVLFQNQSYLRYHLTSYLALGKPNAMLLYEIIMLSYAPGQKCVYTVVELQDRFKTDYAKNGEFLKHVLRNALDDLNNYFGTSLNYDEVDKEGRKIVSIAFVVSKEDHQLLLGSKSIWIKEDIDEDTLYSWPYFVLLQEAYELEDPERIENIFQKLHDIKTALSARTHNFIHDEKELYAKWKLTLDTVDELQELIKENKVAAAEYEYYPKMLTAVFKGSKVRVSDYAFDALQIVKEKIKEMTDHHPSLPGFDESDIICMETGGAGPDLSRFLPFDYKVSARRTVTITKENIRDYIPEISVALEFGDMESFSLNDEQIGFLRAFINPGEHEESGTASTVDNEQSSARGVEKSKSVDAEIVDEEEVVISKAAEEIMRYFIEINPKSKITLKSCQSACDKILFDGDREIYVEDDIYAVLNYLSSKEGSFWQKVVDSLASFQKHFDRLYHQSRSLEGTVPPIPDDDLDLFSAIDQM